MGISQRKKKQRIKIIVIISIVAIVLTIGIVALVKFVDSVFGEKPIVTPEITPTLTPTPIPWDSSVAPDIEHIIASSETLSISYKKVISADKYEISYRSEAGEWQQVYTTETKCFIPINSGFTYHVKVRSVKGKDFGAYSLEAVVSAEAVRPVIKVESSSDYSVSFSWPLTRENATYVFEFKAADEPEWHVIATDNPTIEMGGLHAGKEYYAQVAALKDGFATLSSEQITVTPGGTNYCDPFMNAYAFVTVGSNYKSVQYTSENGCLGAHCWPQFKSMLYSDTGLSNEISELPGGTAMEITPDEKGHYVYQGEGNRFSVHVSATIDGETKSGWTLGNAMFVDIAMIYPQKNLYSIQYNRTNAYSSLFTTGGNGMEVDTKSPEETRYNPLLAKDGKESLEAEGYNVIEGITGKKLPKYGPKEQMPVVWDMALQLLQAQRNALQNGRCLLIYEGYRPNSTSRKVYNTLTNSAFLREETENPQFENKLTLANGFLAKNYTEAYFIAYNSGHNRGVAVDLTLMKYLTVDDLGDEIVVQTKMHTLDYRCDMTYNNTEANLLSKIMTTNTGLVPLRAKQEWWHFELNGNADLYPCFKNYIYADYEI